jgi:sialidase-1
VRLSEPPGDPRPRLLFVNPHNPAGRDRKNLTVKLSYDEGATWPAAKAVEPGPSRYADLAVGPDGWVYCFYEQGTTNEKAFRPRTLTVAKFNLEWLTDGRDRLAGR